MQKIHQISRELLIQTLSNFTSHCLVTGATYKLFITGVPWVMLVQKLTHKYTNIDSEIEVGLLLITLRQLVKCIKVLFETRCTF